MLISVKTKLIRRTSMKYATLALVSIFLGRQVVDVAGRPQANDVVRSKEKAIPVEVLVNPKAASHQHVTRKIHFFRTANAHSV